MHPTKMDSQDIMSVASPAPHVSFLSPPASEQGSERGLEDAQSVRRQGPFHLERSRGGRGRGGERR